MPVPVALHGTGWGQGEATPAGPACTSLCIQGSGEEEGLAWVLWGHRGVCPEGTVGFVRHPETPRATWSLATGSQCLNE